MSFEQLIEELESFSKNMDEDENIQNNAEEDEYEDVGDAYMQDGDDYRKLDGGCYKGADGYYTKVDGGYAKITGDLYTKGADGSFAKMGDTMTKSFTFTTEGGEVIEAVDGTEMVKALSDRLESTGDNMAKAVTLVFENVKSIQEHIKSQSETIAGQGELIKSLTETVERIGGEGRGRKAVLTMHEKQAGQPEPEGVTPSEFMSKAQTAWQEGKLSGDELRLTEALINRGLQPPENILSKVAG